MSAPIPLTISSAADWTRDTRVAVRVDGLTQPDRIRPYEPGDTPLELGQGAFGAGAFGVGAAAIAHLTVLPFAAGFRAVETRSTDAAGNESPWSPVCQVLHRPEPERPRGLRITGTVLSWEHGGL